MAKMLFDNEHFFTIMIDNISAINLAVVKLIARLSKLILLIFNRIDVQCY